MDTLCSVLALGSYLASWEPATPETLQIHRQWSMQGSSLPFPCKGINVTAVWVGGEGRNYFEDF